MPMRPLVSAPLASADDDTLARIDEQLGFADAFADPEYQGVMRHFQGLLGDVDTRQGPVLETVPGRPSPLVAMAAAFAGGLSEFLGNRGAAQAAREGIAQAEERPRQVELQNRQAQMLDVAQRQKDRLAIQLQIGELQAEQAKQNYDSKEYAKQVKANYVIQERMKKLDKETEEAKAANRVNLERIKAEERRSTNASRIKLEHLATSGNEEARLIRDEADAQADAATRRSEAMRRANAAAFGAEVFSESEIRIQEAKERVEIDRIYDAALAKTQGVKPKSEKTVVSAPANTLDDFFKP